MKKPYRDVKSLIAALLAIVLLSACDQQTSNASVASNYAIAPSFQLSSADEQLVSLPRLSNGVDIYLFWATWCPYCGQLMPHLQSIKDEYGDQVNIYAINVSENGDPVEYIKRNGYDFNLLLEGDDIAELYDIEGTPGLVLVDGRGQLRFDLGDLLAPTYKALEGLNHRQRSRRIAPWWAAQVRDQLKVILAQQG